MTDLLRRNPETIARLADLALETNRRQLATADALDSKAWQALGAGSLVIGLGVAGDLEGWGLVLPIASYVAVAVWSLMCLHVRTYAVAPATWGLWKDNWASERIDLDHAIVEALIEGERVIPPNERWESRPADAPAVTNAELLIDKARALRLALYALAAETTTLVLAAAF